MLKRRSRMFIAAGLGVAAFSGTGTAMALTVYEGSNYGYTPSSNGSYAQACDRESDGSSVYSLYTRNDGIDRRVEVFTGNGHCQNSDTSESNPVYRIRVCENDSYYPDPCSSYLYR